MKTQSNRQKERPHNPAISTESTWTRREFLRTGAAGMVGFQIASATVLGLDGKPGANSRVTLAGIGVGGVGFGQLQECEKVGFQIVALCDVDWNYAKKAFDRWPQARRYRDFRELLQSEDDKIDAVYIGVPDHWHALITLAALRRGKHVCCVKPLTRTIREARAVVQAARLAGVATQMTAAPNTTEEGCRTCELIWAGAIGEVREVHLWSSRPLWPQGMLPPDGSDPVPKEFDWKMWQGPAPHRPFKKEWPLGHYALRMVKALHGKPWFHSVYHPWNFRGWWDFGTGALGDMGCHHLNIPFRVLGLDAPRRIEATSTVVFEETAPLASVVTLDFPPKNDRGPIRVVWYDGGLRPPMPNELRGWRLPSEGVLYVGTEGVMLGSKIVNPERAKKFADVPRALPRRGGTWKEWYEACQGGEEAGCAFEWAGPLTEAVLLGNIAIRVGKTLEWDAKAGRFTNNQRANELLDPHYQNGWSLDIRV